MIQQEKNRVTKIRKSGRPEIKRPKLEALVALAMGCESFAFGRYGKKFWNNKVFGFSMDLTCFSENLVPN
jgi:hypothetical protein